MFCGERPSDRQLSTIVLYIRKPLTQLSSVGSKQCLGHKPRDLRGLLASSCPCVQQSAAKISAAAPLRRALHLVQRV